jgi:hypothetical protein
VAVARIRANDVLSFMVRAKVNIREKCDDKISTSDFGRYESVLQAFGLAQATASPMYS